MSQGASGRRAGDPTPSVLEALLEGLPDATVASGRDGRIAFVNAQAERLFGYSREELIGRPVELLWPERLRELYRRSATAYFEAGRSPTHTTEAHGLRSDGTEFVGEMSWGIVGTERGPLLIAVGRDITDRLEMERALRRKSEEQQVVAALGELALAGTDPEDLSRVAAEQVSAILDADTVEVRRGGGATVARFGRRSADAGSRVAVAIAAGDHAYGTLEAVADGPDAFGDEVEAFLRSIANVVAIAHARRRTEERVRHQALHDPLTGLPNRTLCRDRIGQALASGRRRGHTAAVVYVDIDGFKQINDQHGHATGDIVLVAVARRLANAVRPNDTAARVGGDEFVVVCEDVDRSAALVLAERMAEAVRVPLEAAGGRFELTASIGVSLGTGIQRDPEALVAEADAAAYRAKRSGRGRIEVFDTALRDSLRARARLIQGLEHALADDELCVALQPIVSLAGGEVVSAEALIRWPAGGRQPAEFIPIAEESGLIVPIGSWVLEEACRMTAGDDGDPRRVSVNVSARQLAEHAFPAEVAGVLERSRLDPACLALEVTETVLFDVTPATMRAIAELKALGVRLALDDFGTGYSSFQHLKGFPIDTLKIDRSFVRNLTSDAGDRAIVAGLVTLGAAMGIEVIAEGVENPRQADVLRELGCPLAQGFHFGVPQL